MAKKQIAIRIDEGILKMLNDISKQTGKTKTDLIEQAILLLNANEKKESQQIELLSKQNEQLQMAISATKALLQEKDRVIQEKDAVIKAKDELIEELRKSKNKKGFFAWLFGKKE